MSALIVNELSGVLLDLWTARADGRNAKILNPGDIINSMPVRETMCAALTEGYTDWWQPFHVYWGSVGPIIEREGIQLSPPESPVHRYGGPRSGWGESGQWSATIFRRGPHRRTVQFHPTDPLVAAMRAFVASKFGSEVPA